MIESSFLRGADDSEMALFNRIQGLENALSGAPPMPEFRKPQPIPGKLVRPACLSQPPKSTHELSNAGTIISTLLEKQREMKNADPFVLMREITDLYQGVPKQEDVK